LDVFTTWIPLDHVRPQNGMLALVPNTHTLGGFENPPKNRQVRDVVCLRVCSFLLLFHFLILSLLFLLILPLLIKYNG
jgi:hypothetical protein